MRPTAGGRSNEEDSQKSSGARTKPAAMRSGWSTHDRPADLFGWVRDGQLPGVTMDIVRESGPGRIARELLEEWYDDRVATGRRGKRRQAEKANRMSAVAYMLAAFYAQEGQPAPPIVLKVLQIALGLVISADGGTVPLPPLVEFGYIPNVRRDNVPKFLLAAQRDAEHIDAYGKPASDRLLSRSLVEHFRLAAADGQAPDMRKTIAEWRANPAYEPLRQRYQRMRRVLFGASAAPANAVKASNNEDRRRRSAP